MLGSAYFQSYQRNLHRILLAEMIDRAQAAQIPRKLSIAGPSLTHDQWLAAHREQRRKDAIVALATSPEQPWQA